MTTIAALRKMLLKDYKRLSCKGGWRAVGALYEISGAMAYRIANSDYEPKDPHARLRLGLPAYAQAPVCPKCGDLHITKRCTRAKPPAHWADYPIAQLRAALEKREEFT